MYVNISNLSFPSLDLPSGPNEAFQNLLMLANSIYKYRSQMAVFILYYIAFSEDPKLFSIYEDIVMHNFTIDLEDDIMINDDDESPIIDDVIDIESSEALQRSKKARRMSGAVGHSNFGNNKQNYVEFLIADLTTLAERFPDIFIQILPCIYSSRDNRLYNQIINDTKFFHAIISCLYPKIWFNLQLLVIGNQLRMFTPGNVVEILKASLDFESWEQYVTWRIFSAHLQKSMITIEQSLTKGQFLTKIDSSLGNNHNEGGHNEAMSCLTEILANLARTEGVKSRYIIKQLFCRPVIEDEQLVPAFFLSSVLYQPKNTEAGNMLDHCYKKTRDTVTKVIRSSAKTPILQNKSIESKIEYSKRPYCGSSPPYFYVLGHLMVVLKYCENLDASAYNHIADNYQSENNNNNSNNAFMGSDIDSDTSSMMSNPDATLRRNSSLLGNNTLNKNSNSNNELHDDSLQIIGSDEEDDIHGQPLPKINSRTKLFYKFLRSENLSSHLRQIYENCERTEKVYFRDIFKIACQGLVLNDEVKPKRSASSPGLNPNAINLNSLMPNQVDRSNSARGSMDSSSGRKKVKNELGATMDGSLKKRKIEEAFLIE